MERVQLLYDPMIAIVALASRVPGINAMTHGEDPPASDFLIRGLRAYPQIFSLYGGYRNGEFFMISHIAGEQNAPAHAALGAPADARRPHQATQLPHDGGR